MAWTAPRTWVTGEIVTAAIMNTHVRDDLLDLRNGHEVLVFNVGNQNHTTSGSFQTLTFDSDSYDEDGYHNTGANTSRLTVPTGFGGRYYVYGQVAFASSATTIGVRLLTGGVETLTRYQPGVAIAGQGLEIGMVITVADSNYVELAGYQSSGGTLAMLGAGAGAVSIFGMWRVGDA